MYETFEHTADLGIRVRADGLDALFADAARGLFSTLVEDLGTVRPQREVTFRIDGRQKDYLFFDWLNELLFRSETQHILFSEFTVTVGDTGLAASARGEPVDPRRHRLSHEVKAITYHHLKVEQTADGWCAEVIGDI